MGALDDTTDPTDDSDTPDTGVLGALSAAEPTSLTVDPSASVTTSGVGAAYNTAIQRLLAQRSGLTGRQMLGAALVGFGQPTRHGKFGEGVANASQVLLAQTLASRKDDLTRRAALQKLLLARDVAVAKDDETTKTSAEKAAKKAQGSIVTVPGAYPGAPTRSFRRWFDADGTPHVKEVVPDGGAAPAAAVPGAMPPVASVPNFPIQHLTGQQLKDKYGITGRDLNTTYQFHVAGPDAGKVEEEPAEDPLAQYGGATGQALLDQLPPADRAQVDSMAHGAVAPPTAGTRSKAAQRILAIASAAYPGVDFAKNYRTTIDYAPSGKSGQVIVSLGQLFPHAAALIDSAEALHNIDAGPLTGIINGTRNAMQEKTNPAIARFRQNATLYLNELERIVKGSGNPVSLKELEDEKKNLSGAATADVIRGVVQKGTSMAVDRMNSQIKPYNDTLGTNRSFMSWLPPAAQTALLKVDPSYQLTDDDKAYMAQQEAQKRARTTRPKGTIGAPAPSSAKGGAAIPAALLQQYRTVPFGNRAQAKIRLKSAGYDISGLD